MSHGYNFFGPQAFFDFRKYVLWHSHSRILQTTVVRMQNN